MVGILRARRRTIRHVLLGVITVAFALFVSSFGPFVLRDNGDTKAQRAVSWFRNHKLGPAIDVAERLKYGRTPDKKAATSLDLAPVATVAATPATTTTATTTAATTSTVPVSTTAAATPTTAVTGTTIAPATTTTALPTTTTVAPHLLPPTNITPLVVPALDGEGVWRPLAKAAGADAIWVTAVRPLPESPNVVGSFAVIDQTLLTAAMFNGSDVPGGVGWKLGNRVPKESQPALLGAFNGGFRFEHIKGGYKTEGKSIRELKPGEATIAVSKAGKISIGEFGRDIHDDGNWVSFRQNLPLLVDDGKSMVDAHKGTWWGADFGDVLFVLRSSICQRPDGRLMYGAVGKADAKTLAQSLVNMGCQRAMQMDINGTWPAFFTFPVDADGQQHGALIDKRMGGSRDRYFTGSTREFFTFFDTSALPPTSPVLPA